MLDVYLYINEVFVTYGDTYKTIENTHSRGGLG